MKWFRLGLLSVFVLVLGGCEDITGANAVFQLTLDFSDVELDGGEKRVNVVYSFITPDSDASTLDTVFENVLIDDALSLTDAGIEFEGVRRKKLVLDFMTESDSIFAGRDMEVRVLFCDSSESCDDSNAAISRYTFRFATPFYKKSCTAYRFAKLPKDIPAVGDEEASRVDIGKCNIAGCIGTSNVLDLPEFCETLTAGSTTVRHRCESSPSCFGELFDESETF